MRILEFRQVVDSRLCGNDENETGEVSGQARGLSLRESLDGEVGLARFEVRQGQGLSGVYDCLRRLECVIANDQQVIYR